VAEERCPHCGSEVAPTALICASCGKGLTEEALLSPYERQTLRDDAGPDFERLEKSRAKRHVSTTPPLWRVVWLLSLLAILVFRERASVLLKVPGVLPLLAAAILVIGLPKARRSRRPRSSSLGVIGSALVVVGFWLGPTYHVPWIPWVLPLLILALVAFVLPEAQTFHDPGSFRTGVLMIAAAVGSFWPVHAWIAGLELGFREYNVVLHGVGLFFGACMFMGGVWFLSAASNSSADSPDLRCPECASATVRTTLRTPDAVHYCCEACEHLWTIQGPSRTPR
jgi:hypothetical protein